MHATVLLRFLSLDGNRIVSLLGYPGFDNVAYGESEPFGLGYAKAFDSLVAVPLPLYVSLRHLNVLIAENIVSKALVEMGGRFTRP